MDVFTGENLKKLWKPREDSAGEDNGQVTIIGGSELFTGAPLLSLVAASRLVDMVFLATPEKDREAAEKAALFSRLKSVVWVSRGDMDKYIEKSDAVLIGPGMMRYEYEQPGTVLDVAGTETRMLTQYLLSKYPDKKWVIDGGSLQVIEAKWIPKGGVVTSNMKEFSMLFGTTREEVGAETVAEKAKEFSCVIDYKAPKSIVSDGETSFEIEGGNAGLTKGGTGDVLAGVTVGLLAKNDPLLAAAAAAWVVKRTADILYEKVGYGYNADDVGEKVFEVLSKVTS